MGFFMGVLATLVVAVFAPVTFQTGVSWIRGFWRKVEKIEKSGTSDPK